MTGGMAFQTTALEQRESSLIDASRVPTQNDKIEKGAREFEAVLLGSWLQQAEQSFATIPGTDDEQQDGGDQRMSLGVQALATSMAASGGIGIGQMIARAMHQAADEQQQPGVAATSDSRPTVPLNR